MNEFVLRKKLILIFVVQSMVMLVISCLDHQPYKKISAITYDIIQYDAYSDSIWVADFLGKEMHTVKASSFNEFDFNGMQEIHLPVNKAVLSFCVLEEDAWIGLADTFGSDNSAIYKYDKLDKSLIEFSDFNVDECKIINNGSTVFWNENHVLIIDSHEKQNLFDVPERVYDVSQDSLGNIWVATENGGIYLQDSSGELSLQLNESEPTKIFFDTENNLWLVSYEHIVLYRKSNLTHIETMLVDTNDTLYSAFQDKSGKVWLILRKKIVVYDNGQVTYIDLPKDIDNIRYGGVDFINGLMFISSNKGIYTLPLK